MAGKEAAAHGLTRRGVEVLNAFANGSSIREVVRELYVSHKTAKNHLTHVYTKLVVSRTQAVSKAVRLQIVHID